VRAGWQYYRYRGSHGVDPEYPLPLSYWKGVRRPVNDVFQYNGVTYFFSGTDYQVFDDSEFIVSLTHYMYFTGGKTMFLNLKKIVFVVVVFLVFMICMVLWFYGLLTCVSHTAHVLDIGWTSVCPSVSLSITRWYCVETA